MSISYEGVLNALEQCRGDAEHKSLTLGEACNKLHESTYSFICLVLCLPFLQPISLGPLASVGGLTFAVLGFQLARGRETPWVPSRMQKLQFSKKTWEVLIKVFSTVVRVCHRFTRPRLPQLVDGRRGDFIMGSIIVVSGLLMAIPFFGLPFNNTLPALAIVAVCIAELEDDGAFVLVALLLLLVTVAYFAFIFYALFSGMTFVFDYLGIAVPEFFRPSAAGS
jgi:hypothetical protein